MGLQKPRVYKSKGSPFWYAGCPSCNELSYPFDTQEFAYEIAERHVRDCECLAPLRRELLLKSSDSYRVLDSLLEQWIEELKTIPVLPSRL